MPSSAGTGLWLPEVGGLDLYLTFVSTCEEPSIGGLSSTQSAALAAVSRVVSAGAGILDALVSVDGVLVVLVDLSSPPPPETTSTTTTTAAIVTRAPSRNCRRRARVWDAAWAASAASRSSRRLRFSSSLLAMGAAG